MKIGRLIGLLFGGTLLIGAALLWKGTSEPESTPEINTPKEPQEIATKKSNTPTPDLALELSAPSAPPEPEQPTLKQLPKIKSGPTHEEIVQTKRVKRWLAQKKWFDQMLARLEREQDPARRRRLIQQLARLAQIDTLSALDWANSFSDPDEQRMALEAVNQNLVVGIGAQLDVDETGFPRIEYMTELSAIQATGQVESGDYIVGMTDNNGTSVYFDDMSLSGIVNQIRGDAGTEVRLIMARVSESGDSYREFNVPVNRTLVIVQPPEM